ncbi:MAG: CaiB/BaiF CoA-transferase family protein [Anaerolineae bacterium]
MTSALTGIRVLDFTRVLAGPLCTMLLGDLGADVIKIENPGSGDDTRAWGPPYFGEMSAYFACVNRNKRSVTLNLKSPEGQALARQLAAQSHIVIENFKPGQMAGFGLGYDDLRGINPALVYCSITGFGQNGPYHERPGYDFVIQGMTGLMAITGPAEGEPYKVGVAVSDVFTALYTANAIQAALRHAEHTGQGQFIDMALFDSQLAALVNVASNYLASGHNPARYGNEHANIVPYQTFQGADGAFTVAVGNDRQFAQLCGIIGQPALCQDARFATNPARVQHRHLLIPLLQAVFALRPVADWVERLLGAGIPAGPINTVEAALNDPQTAARAMIEEGTLSDGQPYRVLASPLHLSATPAHTYRPPPRLGEHTGDILRERLHLDESMLHKLAEAGVISLTNDPS